MSRPYFYILILLILIIGSGVFYFGIKLYSSWEKAIAAGLQVNLVNNELNYVELKNDLGSGEIANLIFVGDIMLSREIGKMIDNANDPNFPFLKITDILKPADLLFGNLESPISVRGEDQGSEYSFRADPKVIGGLTFAGFDVMSLANNHIWDWGKLALEDTIDNLRASGILSVGAGRNFKEANEPVIKEVQGNKIAFFAFTDLYPESLEAGGFSTGISSFYLERVKRDIKEAKSSGGADIVVVSLHWGEEYAASPSEEQRKIARELANAGVDIIIGHHPHVVQEVERYNNSWIAYSLGNFVFDQNFSEATNEGLIIKIRVRNGKLLGIENIKIGFSKEYQPILK